MRGETRFSATRDTRCHDLSMVPSRTRTCVTKNTLNFDYWVVNKEVLELYYPAERAERASQYEAYPELAV